MSSDLTPDVLMEMRRKLSNARLIEKARSGSGHGLAASLLNKVIGLHGAVIIDEDAPIFIGVDYAGIDKHQLEAQISFLQKKSDMTLRQLLILLKICNQDEPQTVRGLSASTGIPKPAVTRALFVLKSDGFVKKERCIHDRRDAHFSALPAAYKFFENMAGGK